MVYGRTLPKGTLATGALAATFVFAVIGLVACATEPPPEPTAEAPGGLDTDAGTDTSSATISVFQGKVRCAEGGCHAGTATIAAHAKLLGSSTKIAADGHAKLNCTSCHHGDGSVKKKEVAHAPSGLKELLPRTFTGAACAHCHVPGAVEGTELVAAGAKVFLELGCAYCHPGQPAPVGLAPFGPTLVGISARGTKFLAKVLRDPQSVHPGTVMPSFAHELDHAPERDRALMAYLLSLRGRPTRTIAHDSRARCATCHGETPAKATEYPAHRCVLLRAEKDRFACKTCHATGVPASEKECLFVKQRGRECGVCHEGGAPRAR